MIRYTLEEIDDEFNMYLVDDEYKIKILIAVIQDKAHARIMLRKMNEYVRENRLRKQNEDSSNA